MLRPSFQRRMPPTAAACFGGSLIPNMNIMPLIKWTSRSPATPVPYSFQQRQRARREVRGRGVLPRAGGVVASEPSFDEHQVAHHPLGDQVLGLGADLGADAL